MANGRIGSKALTAELRKLASQAFTIEDDGTPVTREQRLAALIWDLALGGTDEVRDDEGNLKKVVRKPVAWAMQYLFERMEGKAPVAMPDAEGGVKAADKVRELAKDRLNALAASKIGPPKHKAKPKGDR